MTSSTRGPGPVQSAGAVHRRASSEPFALNPIRRNMQPDKPVGGDGWVDLDLAENDEGSALISSDSAMPERIDWAFALRWSPPGEAAATLAKINASADAEKSATLMPSQFTQSGSRRAQAAQRRSLSGDVSQLAAAARRLLAGKPVDQKAGIECADKAKAMR